MSYHYTIYEALTQESSHWILRTIQEPTLICIDPNYSVDCNHLNAVSFKWNELERWKSLSKNSSLA